MVLDRVEKNAELIIQSVDNIENDIAYLEYLKKTMTDASGCGANVGTSITCLQSQIDENISKLNSISLEISHKLNNLIELEERISNSQNSVSNDDIEHIDKFRTVYQRLQGDKQTLHNICKTILQWNTVHDVVIDAGPVENLMNDIDTSFLNFDKDIQDIVTRVNGYATLIMSPIKTSCHIDGGGWKLVRHAPEGDKWHKSNDQLKGIDEYGNVSEGPLGPNEFSVKFDHINFREFLFVTGDEQKWLIATKDAVVGKFYNGEKRQIIKSSISDITYNSTWFRREGHKHDPWVCIINFGDAVNSDDVLYGGNSTCYANGVLLNNKGANVYIR